jgi:hypothetical protein
MKIKNKIHSFAEKPELRNLFKLTDVSLFNINETNGAIKPNPKISIKEISTNEVIRNGIFFASFPKRKINLYT